jgi:hypothetical protein
MLDHQAIIEEVNQQKGKKTPPTRPITKDIGEYFGWDKKPVKYSSTSSQQLRWDLELMKLLATCNLPYSLVDMPGFKQ